MLLYIPLDFWFCQLSCSNTGGLWQVGYSDNKNEWDGISNRVVATHDNNSLLEMKMIVQVSFKLHVDDTFLSTLTSFQTSSGNFIYHKIVVFPVKVNYFQNYFPFIFLG